MILRVFIFKLNDCMYTQTEIICFMMSTLKYQDFILHIIFTYFMILAFFLVLNICFMAFDTKYQKKKKRY